MKSKYSNLVFLLGMQRSGTNMVVWSLERMNKTLLFNEDNPIAFSNYELKDIVIPEMLAKDNPNSICIFKSLQDSYRINDLLKYYENAKIIFMIRNFNAVINSQLIAFKDEKQSHFINRVTRYVDKTHNMFNTNINNDIKEEINTVVSNLYNDKLNRASLIGILWWVRNTIFMKQGLYNHPCVITMKYEKVVSNTNEEFRRLCDFINVDYDQQHVKDIHSNSLKEYQNNMDSAVENYCQNLWEQINIKVCQ